MRRTLSLFCLAHIALAGVHVAAKSSLAADRDRIALAALCQPNEDGASFGIFYGGDTPLKLRPLDLLQVDGAAAAQLANPVLTPALLRWARHDAVDAIAEPMLLTRPKKMYMFFSARGCSTGLWAIAAAQSSDEGMTWQSLGTVLAEYTAHIRDPHVFEHNDEWYMVVQNSRLGGVRLYRAIGFPMVWGYQKTILDVPLRGISVVRHNKKWWMIGYIDSNSTSPDGQDHELAIYKAKSPLGPWDQHLNTTFAAEAATTTGRVFKWKNYLHRLGRSCRGGICGEVELLQMFISDESFEQDTVQLDLGRPLWLQSSRWDSGGWRHLAVERRASDGAWLAVMEASRLPPPAADLPKALQAAIAAFKALALLCILLLLVTGATRVPTVRTQLLKQPWGQPVVVWALCPGSRATHLKQQDEPNLKAAQQGGVVKVAVHDHDPSGSPRAGAAVHGVARIRGSMLRRSGGSSRLCAWRVLLSRGASRSGSLWRQLRRRCVPQEWKVALAGLVLLLAVCGAATARVALAVAEPFFEQPQAVPVSGQYSRFTLMVMSYDARLHTLQWYVQYYSQCPSVGEILVVWNKGTPPDPRTAFDSKVPVRVRVEATNSMNNRFRPDPSIRFRAVLSLDDDILIPCTTIEDTFAAWRGNPRQLVGFYPRLLLADKPDGPPVYQFEEYVYQQGSYNAILAGAAFMDSATYFPAYWSNETAPARALVDELFNCDDLLLNFVVAHWKATHSLRGDTPVQLIRPERRLDISRFSGVGISHDPARFKAAADRCLANFTQLFGGKSPLKEEKLVHNYGPAPHCRLWPFDCMYLSTHDPTTP